VLFDLNGDGLSEATGWVKPTTNGGDELFLALDKNQNGNIDSIDELFGNDTTGGFAELAVYDSNKDNLINSSDNQFNLLKIWKDNNANGFFRKENANSVFRKNETFLQSKKSRARVVFKPQAQKSDEVFLFAHNYLNNKIFGYQNPLINSQFFNQ